MMTTRSLIVGGVSAALALATVGVVVSARAGRTPSADLTTTPVLVELFTSEGCSSCPSADRLLRHLDETQPVEGAEIIVLSEHVDYWNRLGWVDPFSSPAFTERQSRYASSLRTQSLYTPQAVVDGKVEVIGNDQPALLAAVRRAATTPKARLDVAVALAGASLLRVTVRGAASPAAADIVVAVVERDLTVQVTRGENARRRLQHTGVVRRMLAAGSVERGHPTVANQLTVEIDPTWTRAALRVVAFAQLKGHGAVTAVGVSAVPR